VAVVKSRVLESPDISSCAERPTIRYTPRSGLSVTLVMLLCDIERMDEVDQNGRVQALGSILAAK